MTGGGPAQPTALTCLAFVLFTRVILVEIQRCARTEVKIPLGTPDSRS